MKNKKRLFIPLLFLLAVFPLAGKHYEKDKKGDTGRGGHLGDLIRLFIGDDGSSSPPWGKFNYEQNQVFEVLAKAAALAIDSTENNIGSAESYRTWLMDRQQKYNLKPIPDVRTFVSPKTNFGHHEWYTHLGWDHYYGGEDQKKWLTGRQILLETVDSLFDFPLQEEMEIADALFKKSKRSSFAALIYYVHILGDHQENDIKNGFTRVPVLSMNEQTGEPGWQGWDNDPHWRPDDNTNIRKDLLTHIDILFADNKDSQTTYNNFKSRLSGVISGNNVGEKAGKILEVLFFYCPRLLREASFTRSFYGKYGL